jgi:hypothetical protein
MFSNVSNVHPIMLDVRYNFIGDFYNKLYPLNLIPFGDMIIPEDKEDTTLKFDGGNKFLDNKLSCFDFCICKKKMN